MPKDHRERERKDIGDVEWTGEAERNKSFELLIGTLACFTLNSFIIALLWILFGNIPAIPTYIIIILVLLNVGLFILLVIFHSYIAVGMLLGYGLMLLIFGCGFLGYNILSSIITSD